ncbi:MAG TPA: LytTR family DNA-binding domain-containing protein [Candidatus Baltobacteraceae bacterium]|nr:LytTR family DNA-binding domain-containing protein [Candidatus Baltobacteraceae bacterium]
MDKIRAIIVDDEEPARRRIHSLLSQVRDVHVAAEGDSGESALRAIRELRPELLFLDVQMSGMNGFDVLTALAKDELPNAVIMVTAYDRYAVRAFDVSAVDYLLKPFSDERFFEALDRARNALRVPDNSVERLLHALREMPERPGRLVVRARDGMQFVDPHEVDWLQAEGNYTILHLGQNQLRIRETVAELERRLGDFGFLRIHRSIIVNADRIFRVEPWTSGEYLLILRNGTKIQSGRSYAENLRRLLK